LTELRDYHLGANSHHHTNIQLNKRLAGTLWIKK